MTRAAWYWAEGEARQGPVDTGELRDMLADGRLRWTVLVWRPGMERWVPAAEVADLELRHDPPPPAPRTHDSPLRGSEPTRPRDWKPEDHLAPFWRRGLAKGFDLLLIVFGMQLLLLLAAPLLPPPETDEWQNVVGVSVTLVYWLYFTAHEGRGRRASLGKQVLGIEVVGTDGRTLSFGRSAARAAVQLFTLGWLMVLLGTQRQSLHDRVADSLVVMRAPPPEDKS